MMVAPLKTVALGEIAEFIRGVTFKPHDVVLLGEDGSIACLRTKNVQAELDLSDVWAIPEKVVKRDTQKLRAGDLLVSSANSWNLVGKCSWVPNLPWATTFGGFVSALRCKSNQVDQRYLYHWFTYGPIQEQIRGCARQTTNIANLSFDQCLALKISLPSLIEQKRIAAILDQADRLRRLRQQSIDRLSDLGQAIFYEMFGDPDPSWQYFPLEEIVRKGTIVTYGIVQAGDEYAGGIPYIRTGDIANGEIRYSNLRRTDPSIAAKFVRSRVQTGDIVMSIRATVGTTALVPAVIDGANLTQGTAKIAPGENTNTQFLLNLLRSKKTQDWIERQVKGATFREITLARLRALPVLVPPLELQNKFGVRALEIEKLKANNLNNLEKLDALFSSLQNQAFRGELKYKGAERKLAKAS